MKVKFLQTGGQAPETAAQPGPEQQLAAMAQQIIDSVGAENALLLAQVIVQMVQGASQQAPQEAPTYMKQGGKLVRVFKK